jgi:hypothetical protein
VRATPRNSARRTAAAAACNYPECSKTAQGSTLRCIAHGGGRRCNFPQCSKSAQGFTEKCKAHGGGRRCNFPQCSKSADGATDKCKAHGGGKRCIGQGNAPCSRGNPSIDNASGLCQWCGGHRSIAVAANVQPHVRAVMIANAARDVELFGSPLPEEDEEEEEEEADCIMHSPESVTGWLNAVTNAAARWFGTQK